MSKPIEAQTYKIRQVRDAIRSVGAHIALARKARKWSQAELGERMGNVDRRHISALEKGDPNVDFGLAVSAAWLLKVDLANAMNGPLMVTAPARTGRGAMYAGNANVAAKTENIKSFKGAVRARLGTTGNVKKVVDNDF